MLEVIKKSQIKNKFINLDILQPYNKNRLLRFAIFMVKVLNISDRAYVNIKMNIEVNSLFQAWTQFIFVFDPHFVCLK